MGAGEKGKSHAKKFTRDFVSLRNSLQGFLLGENTYIELLPILRTPDYDEGTRG